MWRRYFQYDITQNTLTNTIIGHRHGSTTTAIHNKLKSIVNNPVYVRRYNSTTYEVISAGHTYFIDLAQTLVANPVVEFPVNNQLYIDGDGFQYVGTKVSHTKN